MSSLAGSIFTNYEGKPQPSHSDSLISDPVPAHPCQKLMLIFSGHRLNATLEQTAIPNTPQHGETHFQNKSQKTAGPKLELQESTHQLCGARVLMQPGGFEPCFIKRKPRSLSHASAPPQTEPRIKEPSDQTTTFHRNMSITKSPMINTSEASDHKTKFKRIEGITSLTHCYKKTRQQTTLLKKSIKASDTCPKVTEQVSILSMFLCGDHLVVTFLRITLVQLWAILHVCAKKKLRLGPEEEMVSSTCHNQG